MKYCTRRERLVAEWDGRVGDQVNYAINLLYLTITKINYELSTNIISKASNLDLRTKKNRAELDEKKKIAIHVTIFDASNFARFFSPQFIFPICFIINLLYLFKYQEVFRHISFYLLISFPSKIFII